MYARKIISAISLLFVSSNAFPDNSTVIIEMYGDSTTLGVQAGTPTLTTSNSEPNQLQDRLQEKFGKNITVINNGVGGTQSYQLLTGTDGRNRPWAEQMKKSAADFVILNYALNDQLFNATPKNGVHSPTPESYADTIDQLIRIAQKNGKKIILQEPNPTCYQPTKGNLQRFVDALRKEAKRTNTPLVPQYDYIQTIPSWKSMLSDCVHPTDQLYRIKAEQTFSVLSPLIEAEAATN